MTSADGTAIGFDQSGTGPAVILVQGALMDRADPVMTGIAAGLSRWFTVFNYDRRGRGDSGDTRPYAVERETEDLAALIAAAGGSAAVFGGSSGAGLAVQAAARNPAITRLALWEPPYHVDDTAPRLPHDFAAQLDDLVTAGRRADAVELFMVRAAEASPRDVAAMRGQPFWPAMEAAARTLAYEASRHGAGQRASRGPAGRHRPAHPGAQRRCQPGLDGPRGKGRRRTLYPGPCTGCWKDSRTTWRPRPSSRNCWSSSSPPDRAAAYPGSRTPKPVAASFSRTWPGACRSATLAALSSSSWPSRAA